MKSTRFLKLSTLLLTGAMLFSCSDDDEDKGPAATNSFTYSGNEFEIKDGFIDDSGEWELIDDPDGFTPSHYLYVFHMTDGTFELTPNSYYAESNAEYVVYLSLFYSSTTTFGTGEYSFVDPDNATENDLKNKPVFTGSIWFDQNGNGERDWSTEDDLEAVGGTVTVSGSDKNYTLHFELQLEDGKTLKGSYGAEFKYIKG